MKASPVLTLSNELLRLILEQIEPDPDKTVPVDRRQFLSVESFDFPPPSTRGSVKDISAFRSTCRGFADAGAFLLYRRVSTRLSKAGLKRLEVLTEWPHLAKHVKKFSYLVPYFYYDGGEQVRELLPELEASFGRTRLAAFNQKVSDQREIVVSKEDARVLKKAIGSFTSLVHIQLLRVQDEEDTMLLAYLRQNEQLRELVHLDWTQACSHSSRTIGTALLESENKKWSRFSSPMLSPQSAQFLNCRRPESLATLAERLTCLTLHFDDGADLDQKMLELSNLFRTVFTSARNMQSVYIGFPTHRPLNLALEDVFHNVKWEKLEVFSVQGWKLSTDEILRVAIRHAERLKGLRLRDVLLKEGSMWKDVLGGLRESLRRLDWVSLRRIGYARHFDDLWLNAGAEVPDDPPPGESESDSEEDDADIRDDEDEDSESEHERDFESDDEYGPDEHDIDFLSLESPVTPASAPECNCDGNGYYSESAECLGDDGYSVSNAKRKIWERWVVKRCPQHDKR